MIKAIHFPLNLAPGELDDYLARGWFRMGQTIFTTDFIPVNNCIHPVYWLRIVLNRVNYGRKQKRLLTINKDFNINIKPLLISPELEELYSRYRASVDFEAPPTVEGYLLDGAPDNIYKTQVIEIRDAGVLIAAGIFDNGEESIAGIMNFYHPDYKSKSLGKYLMLLKINYALACGRIYYYPGYVAGRFSKFDYKLFPDLQASEYYDTKEEKWLPASVLSLTDTIIFKMDDPADN